MSTIVKPKRLFSCIKPLPFILGTALLPSLHTYAAAQKLPELSIAAEFTTKDTADLSEKKFSLDTYNVIQEKVEKKKGMFVIGSTSQKYKYSFELVKTALYDKKKIITEGATINTKLLGSLTSPTSDTEISNLPKDSINLGFAYVMVGPSKDRSKQQKVHGLIQDGQIGKKRKKSKKKKARKPFTSIACLMFDKKEIDVDAFQQYLEKNHKDDNFFSKLEEGKKKSPSQTAISRQPEFSSLPSLDFSVDKANGAGNLSPANETSILSKPADAVNEETTTFSEVNSSKAPENTVEHNHPSPSAPTHQQTGFDKPNKTHKVQSSNPLVNKQPKENTNKNVVTFRNFGIAATGFVVVSFLSSKLFGEKKKGKKSKVKKRASIASRKGGKGKAIAARA